MSLIGNRIYENGELKRITKFKRNAILSTLTNPGAICTIKRIQVLNPTGKTFTPDECAAIERAINIEFNGKVL